MNLAHLHLIVNHAPLFGSLFALPFLVFGVIRGDERAFRSGAILLVFASAGTALSLFSGDGAAEFVSERIPDGGLELRIRTHEDRADVAAALTFAASLVAAAGSLRFKRVLSVGAAGLAAVAVVALALAAEAGGAIRHAEEVARCVQPTGDGGGSVNESASKK